MFSMYVRAARLALRRAATGWPVAFAVVAYALVLRLLTPLLAPLGMAGGFLLGLVSAACLASYVHLLSLVVAGSRVGVNDVKAGLAARFWDVMSVLFAFWLISLAASIVVRGAGPNGLALQVMIGLTVAFFFNAVPELLTFGASRSFALLADSARFVLANPVVWFLPNVVFAGAALGLVGALDVRHPGELLVLFQLVFSPAGLVVLLSAVPWWAIAPLLALLHFAMVFRGVLFQDLSSGSSRLRAFRSRFE
jgi:hypothetical protein